MESSWLGLTCTLAFYRYKDTRKALYAVFKSPLQYSTTDVSRKYGVNTDSKRLTSDEGQHGTEDAVINPHTKSCTSEVPPKGDAACHSGTNRNGSKRHEKLSTIAPSQSPSISKEHNTTVSMENKEKNSTLHMTTVTPSATTYGLPIKVTALEMLQLKKTREPSKQETWFAVTSAKGATAKLETTASHEPVYTPLLWNSTSQEPVERTRDTDPHTKRGLKRYIALYNIIGESTRLLTPSPLHHKWPLFSKSSSPRHCVWYHLTD